MYFDDSPQRPHRCGFELIGHIAVFAALVGAGACSAQDPLGAPSEEKNGFNNFNMGPGGGFDMGVGGGGGGVIDQGPPFIPEIEEDFQFSQPAVVGQEVFIANETLNSVAVIDSTSLVIRTLPVGFRPTAIVGPERDASTAASRVVVLNEGSNSVSIIDPETRAMQLRDVMDGANTLTANADASAVVAWYDDDLFEDGDPRGDLSSVTLIKGTQVHQIAVGFHVRQVVWVEGSERLLVVTDDGVSVIETDQVSRDRIQVPVPVLPRELIPRDPRDLEVLVDASGQFAVARISTFKGVVVTSLEDQSQSIIALPEIPTDIDMIAGADPGVMVMLPRTEAGIIMSLPDGAERAAMATTPAPALDDMGQDMMMADLDMDASEDMQEGVDLGDMDFEDMTSPEDMAAEEDMGVNQQPRGDALASLRGIEGVEIIALPEGFALGAAVVSGGGEQALIYTTRENVSLGVLHDIASGESREVFFEKGIKAVIADERGETFVAFHSREESSEEVIAKSWGLSVVDVSSATPRLIITEHEPWRATLWSVEGFAPRAYVIFKRPVEEALVVASQRDVLGVNLDTFSVNSFRVSSPPEGIGAIPAAGRVYINQTHPQGRMTFVDVSTGKQQTVTGYQLNARID